MDNNQLQLVADAIVMIGIGVLGFSLILVRQLITELPTGILRQRWKIMGAMIGLFVVGYLYFLFLEWPRDRGQRDLVMSAVFFLGSIFVWLGISSALFTVKDLRRVALLERETIVDPLIGIYNRRYLDRRLEEECSRARRYGNKLSVMMLDIDYFKRVNDTYGHQAGDLILSHLGRLILAVIRTSDVAVRYGGEELVVIAPETPIDEAAIFANRLRQYVETHPLMLDCGKHGRQEVGVTVSIGVAELSREIKSCETLMSNADQALYQAKQNGRNRVEIWN